MKNSPSQASKKNTSERNDFLKLIAIIAMVFDHVGFIFFPWLIEFRLIGRLAFPVFAAGIAQGYQYSRNLKKYSWRLFIFALISQIPFALIFGKYELNVIFTLLASLFFIYALDKKKYFLLALILLLIYLIKLDYGLYGVILASFFYFFKNNNFYLLLSLLTATALYSYFYNIFQIFAVFSFMSIVYLPLQKFSITLPRYFFYWFYPVHLLILWIVYGIITKYQI